MAHRSERSTARASDEPHPPPTIRLAETELDPGALLSEFCAGRSETGAVASFVGLARSEAGQVLSLELEAYRGFTEREIARFAEIARDRFGLQGVLIVHRIGGIAPGEPIVFVAAAAAHRRAAFEACDFLMDYLKSRAPFWKKETGPDGERWIEPRPEDHADIARWET